MSATTKGLNWNLLHMFGILAEQGSVTRAAEVLGRGQPAVSAALKKLEDQLGCRLVTRTARSFSLTDVGQVLYLQIIPLLVFYFSPTPGSSGLAEVSTMAAMAPVLPKSYQAAYVIVWRFFTLIINMIIGSGVVMSYISGKRGRAAQDRHDANTG